MENLEILKEIVKPETYALLEEETKDSTIKLADLSSGAFVSKDKYGALENQLNSTTELLNTKTAEYDTLKGKAGDNEALKTEIETMKTAFETEKNTLKSDYEAQLKKSAIVTKIMSDYKPKDVNDVISHIDIEKISIDGDNFVGLKEQVDPLKESKAYYFQSEEPAPHKSGLPHDVPGDDLGKFRAAFGLKEKE